MANTTRFTLRRLLWTWAVLGIGTWVVLGALLAQAECPADSLFCPGPGALFAITGVLAAVTFFLSGLAMAIVWVVVEAWLETRREHRTTAD
jgi:hypothetical protein